MVKGRDDLGGPPRSTYPFLHHPTAGTAFPLAWAWPDPEEGQPGRGQVPIRSLPYLLQVDDEGVLTGEGLIQLILRDVFLDTTAQLGGGQDL